LQLEPEGIADGGLGPVGEPLDGPLAEGGVTLHVPHLRHFRQQVSKFTQLLECLP